MWIRRQESLPEPISILQFRNKIVRSVYPEPVLVTLDTLPDIDPRAFFRSRFC